MDPIEKKPLIHFYPGSSILSFGTVGCNMGCSFCQNWPISKSTSEELLSSSAFPEDIAEMAVYKQCPSVAFTYNEPIVYFEYALETAKICRERGLKTVAVTAGYIEEGPRKEFFSLMDAANVDLKSIEE